MTEKSLALHWKSTPLGMIEWDLDFNIVAMNPAAQHIFGYPQQEAAGQKASAIIPETEHDKLADAMNQLRAGADAVSSRNLNHRRDGSLITCQWYYTPLLDADDRIVGYASLVQDISQQ